MTCMCRDRGGAHSVAALPRRGLRGDNPNPAMGDVVDDEREEIEMEPKRTQKANVIMRDETAARDVRGG